MNKLLEKYQRYILNPHPNKTWRNVRAVLNWITIPLKLLVIGSLGVYGIIYNRTKYKKREPQKRNLTQLQKVQRVQRILKFLPVVKNEFYDLYLPRNKFTDPLNGAHHNSDHQLLRHGQYVFAMSKLGKRTPQMDYALAQFMQGRYLARGYSWDFETSKFKMNLRSTSGDMLIGLCLSMLDTDMQNDSQTILMERFDQLVTAIIDNDYSLLEGSQPTDEPYKTIYQELLKKADDRPESVAMKSSRGMWQPGLETVGAQALTILAALKVNSKKNKSHYATEEYWNLFYKQGYALLSLLPTAYLPNRRGYFNDANCIQALYVLLKLADTKLEKMVYRFALRYVFNLSKSWYNMYFTGLVREVAPDMVSDEYLEQVKEYLYEEDPLVWTISEGRQGQTFTVPVPLGLLSHSEFAFGDKLDHFVLDGTGIRVFTGLSELASMAVLEEGLREVLSDPKRLN